MTALSGLRLPSTVSRALAPLPGVARRVRGPVTLAVATVLLGCLPTSDPLQRVSRQLHADAVFQPRPLPTARLLDQRADTFDLRAAARGKVTLLYFGYTFCPDVCPITMTRVAAALERLEPGERSEVLGVFVTLDPDRDTPERLAQWLGGLHPDLVGITGTMEELDGVLGQLGYVRPPSPEPTGPDYEVAHPAELFLFTPDRMGRFSYGPNEQSAEEIADDIRRLLGLEWSARAEPAG